MSNHFKDDMIEEIRSTGIFIQETTKKLSFIDTVLFLNKKFGFNVLTQSTMDRLKGKCIPPQTIKEAQRIVKLDKL